MELTYHYFCFLRETSQLRYQSDTRKMLSVSDLVFFQKTRTQRKIDFMKVDLVISKIGGSLFHCELPFILPLTLRFPDG
jgi:hypothetical protein